jgi:ABC-type Fe3+-hydroxamate transport system substrate-binding protein
MLFSDHTGYSFSLEKTPQRIISLVPSQTELLIDLGLEKSIVGITKYCIHPREKVKRLTKIGGTKDLDIKKIESLQPDLIIGNKEENTKEQIEFLRGLYPVWLSDVNSLDDAIDMIKSIGKLCNIVSASEAMAKSISTNFDSIVPFQQVNNKTVYFIWKDPYIVVANDTFIHDMITKMGLENCFAHQSRYPEISIEYCKKLEPDYILLSTEPYSFKEKHLSEFKIHFPKSKVMLVDGELFSWYGSRLLKSPSYFNQLSQDLRSMT